MDIFYTDIKNLLKEGDYIARRISIPFKYVLSAKKDDSVESSWGFTKYQFYTLTCSDEELPKPTFDHHIFLERFFNQLLNGEIGNPTISIYLPPSTLKGLPIEFENPEFVKNDFKSKIERYIEIMQKINSKKSKDFNINNITNICVDYSERMV